MNGSGKSTAAQTIAKTLGYEYISIGNMKRKLLACREAFELGIPRIYLADGRVKEPLGNAERGNGTCLTL